jgi:hypothetical protein
MSKSGGSNWLCECDCGNKNIVYGPQLNFGAIKSCGCLQREAAAKTGRARKKNLTGMRFGKLLVLEEVSYKRGTSRNIFWKCICDCGKESVVNSSTLINGQSKSCGCAAAEAARRRALTLVGPKSVGWKGGISFEPYCPKFNNDLKKRIREFFNNQCLLCGKSKEENGKNLSCHHVEYNKLACCDGKPVQFAALCHSCHAKTNPNRERWESIFHSIINHIYNGKSYYTKDEFCNLHNGDKQ